MVKGFFGNLKKIWRCRKNFGSAGRKTLTQIPLFTHFTKCKNDEKNQF